MVQSAFVSFFALALLGCASSTGDVMTLSPGMSTDEIVEAAGAPDDRTFRGPRREAILYVLGL